MIAQAPVTHDLREIAGQAWEYQQACVAERKRQQIEQERQRVIVAAREALASAFAQSPADHSSPFTLRDIRQAALEVASTDDLLMSKPDDVIVRISFMGERFEYRNEGDGFALWHEWACAACGEVVYPMPHRNVVHSLADLGEWLAYAPTIHTCDLPL